MVIKAPRRTGRGITAGPDAQVDGVDRMAVGDGVLSQGGAQGIDSEATRSQRVTDATPAAAMQWLQAEVGQRSNRLSRQQGVQQARRDRQHVDRSRHAQQFGRRGVQRGLERAYGPTCQNDRRTATAVARFPCSGYITSLVDSGYELS